jgi:hypothetical protein
MFNLKIKARILSFKFTKKLKIQNLLCSLLFLFLLIIRHLFFFATNHFESVLLPLYVPFVLTGKDHYLGVW